MNIRNEKLLNFYAENFKELDTLLRNYADVCLEMNKHIKEKSYTSMTKEQWYDVVDKYRKVHRKMIDAYRYIPSEVEMEYFI